MPMACIDGKTHMVQKSMIVDVVPLAEGRRENKLAVYEDAA